MKNADKIEKFEVKALPFDNITIGGFKQLLEGIVTEKDGLKYVEYESLKLRFSPKNQVWEEALHSRDTVTSKVFLSEEFSVQDNENKKIPDAIDYDMLICFALLYGAGKRDSAKAKIFYQVLV